MTSFYKTIRDYLPYLYILIFGSILYEVFRNVMKTVEALNDYGQEVNLIDLGYVGIIFQNIIPLIITIGIIVLYHIKPTFKDNFFGVFSLSTMIYILSQTILILSYWEYIFETPLKELYAEIIIFLGTGIIIFAFVVWLIELIKGTLENLYTPLLFSAISIILFSFVLDATIYVYKLDVPISLLIEHGSFFRVYSTILLIIPFILYVLLAVNIQKQAKILLHIFFGIGVLPFINTFYQSIKALIEFNEYTPDRTFIMFAQSHFIYYFIFVCYIGVYLLNILFGEERQSSTFTKPKEINYEEFSQ